MYNPQELQRRAQLNLHGVDTKARTTIETNPPKEENDSHWLVRGLATVGNFVSNVVEGAVKSLEGIVDAGAMLVGLFGADVNDFVEYDFTSDVFGTDEEGEGLLDWAWGRNLADVSYLDNDHIVNQIAEGVGGMLPTIALAVATGGTSLAGTAAAAGAKAVSVGAKVANIASKVAFIGGAVGNASETALKEGADYWQALGYGAVSGAIEGATEMIGGRVFGSSATASVDKTLLGKLGLAPKLGSKLGTKVYSFASEGLEEVVADLLDPVNKKVFGLSDTIEMPTIKELGKTFVVGGTVGAVLDKVNLGASALLNRKEGGIHYAKVSEKLNDIANVGRVVEGLQNSKKVSNEKMEATYKLATERYMDDIEFISSEFKKMSPEQRTKAFETLRVNTNFVDNVFNPDGTIKDGVMDKYSEVINNGAKYNVSSNLLYEKNRVETDIKEINAKYKANYEISDVKLNDNQRVSFAKINRNISKISNKTGTNLELVIIKDYVNADGVNTNGFIDKNRIYITESALENGDWAKPLSHEISHYAIGSKEFLDYAKYITSDKKLLNTAIDNVVANYYDDFGFSVAEGNEIVNKIAKGETRLTDKEIGFYDEVVAHITEDLFQNEKSVNRFARENTSLASKILSKIQQFLAIFKGTNANKQTVVKLRKAEILFERALEGIKKENQETSKKINKATEQYKKDKDEYLSLPESERENWLKDKGYKKEDFADDVLYNGEELDNSGETRYSKKGYAYRNPNSVNEKDFNHHYWAIAYDFLSKEEIGVLDSAIGKIKSGDYYSKNADGFYMIPVGENGVLNKIVFTDGNYERYSIDTIIEINSKDENTLSKERENIYVSEYKGIQTQTNELLKVHYAKNYRFSEFRAESESNLRNSNGKQDGTRSDGETRFSKDGRDVRFSKRTARYINNKLDTPTLSHIKKRLREIYGDVDSAIADGIAIEKENAVFVVDSSVEDGNIDFGVRQRKVISNDELRKEFIRRKNDKSIRNGYISDGLSSRFGDEYDDSWNGYRRWKSGEELSINKGQSENNESRVFREDGDNRGRGLRFSKTGGTKISQISILEALDPIKIKDEKEYKRLARELKLRNGNHPLNYEWVTTNDYLYIVKNNNGETFDPVIKIEIDRYFDFCASLFSLVKKENINSEATIKLWVSKILDHPDNVYWLSFNPMYEPSYNELAFTEDAYSRQDKEFDKGVDSAGKKLTKKQIEFYKNSKVRDRYGRLKVVYHGSFAEFYVFDKALLGSVTKAQDAKEGFFFTDDLGLAKDYAEVAKWEKLRSLMLSIAEGDKEVVDFLKSNRNPTIEDAKRLGSKDLETLVDITDNNRKGKIYKVYLNIENPYVENWGHKGYNRINLLRAITKAKFNGHDGVIIKRINDSILEKRPNTNIYIVFEPEQIKLTTNKAPTNSHDIRFSKKGYSPRDIDSITSREYYHHAWAFINNVITKSEWGVVNTAIADIKISKKYPCLKNVYMVPTGEYKGKDTIYNKIVFTDGNFETPSIIKVLQFSKEFEKENKFIEWLFKEYENGQSTNQELFRVIEMYSKQQGEMHCREFSFKDFGTLQELKEQRRNVGEVDENNQGEPDGRRNTQEDSGTIRFSRKASEGETKKKLADISKKKVYSKKEAQEIVSTIIGDVALGGGNYIRVTNKNQEMIADELWKVLNTYDSGKRVGVSEKIADYIIDSAIMHNVYDEEINDASIETVATLRKYLHKINLDDIKDEIKYHFDKNNSPYLLWSKRKGEKGYSPDELAGLLKEDGIFLESINGADMFFEMDSLYRKAVKDLKTKKTKFLNEALDEGERTEIRKDIRNEILKAFATNGSKSKLAKIIETYSRKAKVWKDLYYEEKTRNNNINSLLKEIKNLKGLEEFKNATQYKSEQFKGSIEKLEKLDWRGNLNESGARNIVANLNAWYNRNNKIIGDRFDTEVSETLSEIASGEGKLNSTEIRNLANVVTYFRHFIETSTKIYRQDKWVDAKPIAEDYVAKMKASENIKFGPIGSVLEKVMSGKYVENFSDPMALARYMDKYEDGFYTNTVQSFREGAIGSARLEMELRKTADEFFRKNKKYLKDLQNKFITYRGVEIPLGKAISLYMTLNRDQAILGLAKAGFKFENLKTKKTIEVKGFEVRDDLTFDEYKGIAREVQAEIGKQLTETDLKFIKIVENDFEKCKKYKYDRDMQLRGYSNVIEGYYFPIRRIAIAERIDRDYFNGDRVSNQSFNKSIVKGAQQALFIDSIENIFVRHVRGIAQYYHLAPVIENYDIINNLDIGENLNAPISVASTSVNVWKNGSEYLKKMLADIQGVKNGDGSRLFGFLRVGFAKFQLGANPKVWFSQLASLFASTSILDYGSIIKGFGMKTADVDKYCMLAEYRNNDNVAVKSQGVIDEIGKIGDVLTKPIGFTDRLVIRALFGACQVQVQKENGLKIGTEENKIKAGQLLTKVILETQQNNLATERSNAMRSSSELKKTFTMFTADAMKVLGRVVDSFGRVSVIKARLRITTDAKETERLKSELKSAHKDARKSVSALVVQAAFLTVLAQLFKKFYNKDDEEEQVNDIALDFLGNMIGGLPILKDFVGKVTDGYDVNNYATSSINDLFEAIGSLGKVVNGDSRERASSIRKILYATGQIFGIPVRNLYNVFYGTTNLISPESAYKMDDMFYKQSYRKDLKKAIENEDYDMISTIAGLITKEDVGVFSGNTREEIARLLANGQDVLPTSIGNTMTINETQYTLDGSQKEAFKSVYSGAITSIDKLVSTNGYKVASDEAKAKAIKYVYRYYYYMAQQKVLGVEIDSKLFLFGKIISIEKLALALAEVPLLVENSKNKKQVVERCLQASKLSVLEKYLLMGYFGYKTTKGESMIKSAINRSSLSKEQKNKLLEKCGLKKEQV